MPVVVVGVVAQDLLSVGLPEYIGHQDMTAEQHLGFARRFGELEVHPFIPSKEAQPDLGRFAKGPDTGGYENQWHHDVTWREQPSRSTILRAVEVPDVGGDTLFADMCAAHYCLPVYLRVEAEVLSAVHPLQRAFGHEGPLES